jgi:hypothetical protein
MQRLEKGPLKCMVRCGICGLLTMSSAVASPPASHEGLLGRMALDSFTPRQSDSMRSASARLAFSRLDLRAPTDLPTPYVPASTSIPFPSVRRTRASAIDQEQLPALGADGSPTRVKSRPEEILRRIHNEGLPIARLWESHSAFLSVGLNQRGKPGLWLIQKIK